MIKTDCCRWCWCGQAKLINNHQQFQQQQQQLFINWLSTKKLLFFCFPSPHLDDTMTISVSSSVNYYSSSSSSFSLSAISPLTTTMTTANDDGCSCCCCCQQWSLVVEEKKGEECWRCCKRWITSLYFWKLLLLQNPSLFPPSSSFLWWPEKSNLELCELSLVIWSSTPNFAANHHPLFLLLTTKTLTLFRPYHHLLHLQLRILILLSTTLSTTLSATTRMAFCSTYGAYGLGLPGFQQGGPDNMRSGMQGGMQGGPGPGQAMAMFLSAPADPHSRLMGLHHHHHSFMGGGNTPALRSYSSMQSIV